MSTQIILSERIENKILLIRGHKIILDRDMAELYGVPTMRLNEQVKRNIDKFPDDFMFQLDRQELENKAGETDTEVKYLFEAIRQLMAPVSPKRKIGFGEGKIKQQ
jgi:hypothetical protein